MKLTGWTSNTESQRYVCIHYVVLAIDKARSQLNESNKRAQVITIQDEPPNWTSDSDMGLESISEPDIDLPEDEDDFSDAPDHPRSRSGSPDTSLPSASSKFAEEGDTEEDPVDPITPAAGRSSFVNIIPPEVMQKSTSTDTSGSASSAVDSLSFDDEDDVEWVAHDVMTPQQEYTRPASAYDPDPLAESQATISAKASHDSNLSAEPVRQKKKSTKKKHVKVPPQQYPFPATPGGEDASKSPPRRVPQMRTAKARDGGRTQSGGVRGVPADDIDDF